MKKLTYSLFFLFLMLSTGIKAQTATGSPDANYGILENKLKRSNDGVDDEKKNIKAKFWTSRAELMMDIFDVNRQYLNFGFAQINIKLIFGTPKETTTWTEDGDNYEKYIYDRVSITFKNGGLSSYEDTKPIHPDPLPIAFESLVKAKELDLENKESKDIKTDYVRLKLLFEKQAIEQFLAEKYEASFNSFTSMIKINEKPIMNGVIDTIIYYNAGMAAGRAKMKKESLKYFELARTYNHQEPVLYVNIKKLYFEEGDTLKGLEALLEGNKKFPRDQVILRELTNFYIHSGEVNKAMEYLKRAQLDEPEDIELVFAEGMLYDQLGDLDNALAAYKRCTDMDPTYFNGYFNSGVSYFNAAVKMYEEANSILDEKEYAVAKGKADEEVAKSLPFIEKAYEIRPTDCDAMETLKTIYYRMKMTDKYDSIVISLKASDCEARGAK